MQRAKELQQRVDAAEAELWSLSMKGETAGDIYLPPAICRAARGSEQFEDMLLRKKPTARAA